MRRPDSVKSSNNSILLRNCRAVLPKHISEKTDILIQGRLIQRIFDSSANVDISSEVSFLDLEGWSLYPGFIDVHIHGSDGVDTMEADGKAIARSSRFLASQGVTGWMPTLVPAPLEDYQRAMAAIEDAASRGCAHQ